MPVSAVIELQPQSDAPIPSYTGRMVHGWFMEWVTSVAPDRARALHRCKQVNPFTLSGLECRDDPAWFRITSFENDLSGWLECHLKADLPGRVKIGGADYRVLEVHAGEGAKHRWTGRTTYREMVDCHLDGRDAPEKVGLRFYSPTTFRSGGVNVPLPLPDLVFGSLADRWAAYSTVNLDDAIRAVTAGQVVISRHSLQTRAVQIKGGCQVGFTGYCDYTVLARNPYWRQVCGLLADFAFYAGVGYKTAQGMGQARRVGRDSF